MFSQSSRTAVHRVFWQGFRLCTFLVRLSQICSIGYRSGLRGGHSRRSIRYSSTIRDLLVHKHEPLVNEVCRSTCSFIISCKYLRVCRRASKKMHPEMAHGGGRGIRFSWVSLCKSGVLLRRGPSGNAELFNSGHFLRCGTRAGCQALSLHSLRLLLTVLLEIAKFRTCLMRFLISFPEILRFLQVYRPFLLYT